MKKLIGAALLGGAVFALPAMAQTSAAPPVKCRVAEVNPVTNRADCIDPIGGSLDPKDNPCQGMHRTGQWTMSNSCDTAPGGNPTPN
ncbi:MAG: hypothetical protein ACREC1_07335 [Methylovirgula sp.]